MRSPRLRLSAVAALVSVGPVAQAQGTAAVRLDPGDGLPFSSGELADAVGLRVPLVPAGAVTPGLDPVTVRLESAAPGVVRIEVAGLRRDVVLGDRRGDAAARVVAILVADLIEATRGLPASPEPPEPPLVPTFVSRSVAEPAQAPPAPRPVSSARSFLGAEALGELGLLPTRPALGVGLRGALALRGPWAVAAAASWSRAQESVGAMLPAATFDAVPLRLGVGYRRGPLQMDGGVSALVYLAGGADSDARTGVIPGAFVAASVGITLPWGLRPYAAVTLDAFAGNVRLEDADDVGFLETRRIAPRIAFGIAWERR